MSILIKSGLLLSIISFGFFMLATGMVLSDTRQLPGWLGGIKTSLGTTPTDKATSALSPDKEAAQPKIQGSPSKAGVTPDSQKKESPIPLTVFELVRNPSDKTRYGLQIGLYSEKDQAVIPLTQLEKAHLKPQWFSVVDSQQTPWYLLSTGNYKTLSIARSHLYQLLNRYNLPNRVIQLPAPKEK